ncbi:GNAT family N-acetyltransferase [Spirosoma sp. SC4-14]|uniref:GNAT family N-acetyltransferase n=1 Tax=Spirosoma sp. SC4-14 TaxID=3128900 RepID=UPI0030D3915C
MEIRPFNPSDTDQLLTVFRESVPGAFGINEVDEYAEFLRTNTDPYFVATYQEKPIGACGYYCLEGKNVARICWILTDPAAKGLGVGGALLTHTLNLIRQQTNIQQVECRTSQVAYRFFEKYGFRLHYTEPDMWAPGLDLYFMTLAL